MEQKEHHHHHHHHHRKSRRLKLAAQRAMLLGVCTVAVCATLLILYCGMRGRDNMEALLLRLLPVFVMVGLVVGGGYYLIFRRQFWKDQR